MQAMIIQRAQKNWETLLNMGVFDGLIISKFKALEDKMSQNWALRYRVLITWEFL
jgi:hypothetical protein